MEPKLITEYEVELTEPGCTPGSGKLAVAACLKADISGALPYLNGVLTGADYYPEDHLLIFRTENRAFIESHLFFLQIGSEGQAGL
ncbi:hypothetical protein ACFLWF_01890, partial [Chloroflexota bacterium]